MMPRSMSQITTAIFHCAATPNGRFHTIEDVDYWHGPDRINRGLRPFQREQIFIKKHQPHLRHVGYHFVIRTDGVLESGRSLEEVGAHARKFNSSSVGICLIGTDAFTEAQWTTAKSLILTLHDSLPKLSKIIGHRAVNEHKTCPGFEVRAWMDNDFNSLHDHLLEV